MQPELAMFPSPFPIQAFPAGPAVILDLGSCTAGPAGTAGLGNMARASRYEVQPGVQTEVKPGLQGEQGHSQVGRKACQLNGTSPFYAALNWLQIMDCDEPSVL